MQNKLIAVALVGMSFLSASFGAIPQPVDEVLPIVGTGGHGHTYPGATVVHTENLIRRLNPYT